MDLEKLQIACKQYTNPHLWDILDESIVLHLPRDLIRDINKMASPEFKKKGHYSKYRGTVNLFGWWLYDLPVGLHVDDPFDVIVYRPDQRIELFFGRKWIHLAFLNHLTDREMDWPRLTYDIKTNLVDYVAFKYQADDLPNRSFLYQRSKRGKKSLFRQWKNREYLGPTVHVPELSRISIDKETLEIKGLESLTAESLRSIFLGWRQTRASRKQLLKLEGMED